MTANSSGTPTARQTYYAYGTVRTTDGLPTDYTFTGQKLDASSGLMYYGARYYDAAIGRFAQPDSIVPNPYNPQSLNRYSYVLNNPVRYTDPTGHWFESAPDIAFIVYDLHQGMTEGWTVTNSAALAADLVCLVVPFGTGGGLAVRAGEGAMAVAKTAVRIPVEARAAQSGLKLLQAASGKGSQPTLPGFEDGNKGSGSGNPGDRAEDWVSNKLGVPRNNGAGRIPLEADYFTSKTKTRFPEFDPKLTPGKIVEVKDRARVDLTENLPDFVEYARQNGLKVDLWVRKDSFIDSEILKLTEGDDPLVILEYLFSGE